MTRAVFLDRDGVLNRQLVRDGKPYPPVRIEDFNLLPGVAEACARLKADGWQLIVATNQPDVGRGTLDREIVEAMHEKMCALLPLDRVEVCYDPGQGIPSENRKPAPGMLLRAAADLGLELRECWMVGDRWRDIDCGHRAGCRTIFIDWGYDETLRAQPDHRVRNLAEAADIILKRSEPLAIRPAAAADIEPLRELATRTWRAHYPGIIPVEQIEYMLGWMYAAGEIAAQLQRGVAWDIAESRGTMVAFASYEQMEDGRVKLHKLYVAPDRQRRGIGARLLAHVLQRARELGGREVWMQVNKRNTAAIAAYEKAGFHVAQEAVFDIGRGFVMDDFLMAKRL